MLLGRDARWSTPPSAALRLLACSPTRKHHTSPQHASAALYPFLDSIHGAVCATNRAESRQRSLFAFLFCTMPPSGGRPVQAAKSRRGCCLRVLNVCERVSWFGSSATPVAAHSGWRRPMVASSLSLAWSVLWHPNMPWPIMKARGTGEALSKTVHDIVRHRPLSAWERRPPPPTGASTTKQSLAERLPVPLNAPRHQQRSFQRYGEYQ